MVRWRPYKNLWANPRRLGGRTPRGVFLLCASRGRECRRSGLPGVYSHYRPLQDRVSLHQAGRRDYLVNGEREPAWISRSANGLKKNASNWNSNCGRVRSWKLLANWLGVWHMTSTIYSRSSMDTAI